MRVGTRMHRRELLLLPVVAPVLRNRNENRCGAQARGVANSGASFAVAFADVNGDEAPDMFVTNSGSENALYLNNGQVRCCTRFYVHILCTVVWMHGEFALAGWGVRDGGSDGDGERTHALYARYMCAITHTRTHTAQACARTCIDASIRICRTSKGKIRRKDPLLPGAG